MQSMRWTFSLRFPFSDSWHFCTSRFFSSSSFNTSKKHSLSFLLICPQGKGIPLFDGRKMSEMDFLHCWKYLRWNYAPWLYHCLWTPPLSRYLPQTGQLDVNICWVSLNAINKVIHLIVFFFPFLSINWIHNIWSVFRFPWCSVLQGLLSLAKECIIQLTFVFQLSRRASLNFTLKFFRASSSDLPKAKESFWKQETKTLSSLLSSSAAAAAAASAPSSLFHTFRYWMSLKEESSGSPAAFIIAKRLTNSVPFRHRIL